MKQLILINTPRRPTLRERTWIQSFEEVAQRFAKAARDFAKKPTEEHYKALYFQRMCFETMVRLDKW
jgi:hypothetical protein